MKHSTLTLVSCIALLLVATGTAVAANNTTATATSTPANASKTPYFGDVAGDPAVRIVSAEYTDGTVVLELESDLPRTVTVTAPTGSDSVGAASGNLASRSIPPGRTTIRIASPEPRVTLVTSYSIENGKYTEIRLTSGSSLISGPFTGKDVRDATIGGALGTGFGALLIIVRRRFGLHRGMERVA
ncbi:hypothetical protein KU306_01435 [Haloferax larsenii]|uniref:Uncharacterized protein n=1 Tax=Haloferax larsenii TaxID=302484 RepID=A0ABY5RGB5_HALLR|nr:hypothetical protein [Haloferax larsenii]UVE50595.1 hypothetical protein KU306_01435 [Haloferax larsenii]